MAVFMEKHTVKNNTNSSKPSSQTPPDESALGRPGAKGTVHNGVPVTVQPMASCTISVNFAPGGVGGVFNGSFDIQSNAPSSPDTISLSGAVAIPPIPPVAVPGLNAWGLGLLSLLLGWFGWRRRKALRAD